MFDVSMSSYFFDYTLKNLYYTLRQKRVKGNAEIGKALMGYVVNANANIEDLEKYFQEYMNSHSLCVKKEWKSLYERRMMFAIHDMISGFKNTNSISDHAFVAYEFMRQIRILPESTPPSWKFRSLSNTAVVNYNVFVGTYIYRYHILLEQLNMRFRMSPELLERARKYVTIAFNVNNKMPRLINGVVIDTLPRMLHLSVDEMYDFMNMDTHKYTASIREVVGHLYEYNVPMESMDNFKKDIAAHKMNNKVEKVAGKSSVNKKPAKKVSRNKEIKMDMTEELKNNGEKIVHMGLPGATIDDIDVFDGVDKNGKDVIFITLKKDTFFMKSGDIHIDTYSGDSVFMVGSAKLSNGVLSLHLIRKQKNLRKVIVGHN